VPKKAAAQVAQSLGFARQNLDQQEEAGAISIAEAAEIKERTRLITAQDELIQKKRQELADLSTIRAILGMEKDQFLLGLLERHGLDTRDGYNVQSDTGTIWRVAKSVEVLPPPAEDVTESEADASA
jgi:hypothetical protein